MVTKNKFSQDDLDPEIIKIRDQIINKIGSKPLEEINSIVKKLLNDQMDENTRLGVLAARLKIIRLRIETLYEKKNTNNNMKKVETLKKTVEEKKDDISEKSQWMRIRLLESSDINGKQIDKGVIVDVKKDDGKKLIVSKRAEEVKEEQEINVKTDIEKKNNKPSETLDANNDKKTSQESAKNQIGDEVKDVNLENEKKPIDNNNKKDLLKQHEEKVETNPAGNDAVSEKKKTSDVEKSEEGKGETQPVGDEVGSEKEKTSDIEKAERGKEETKPERKDADSEKK